MTRTITDAQMFEALDRAVATQGPGFIYSRNPEPGKVTCFNVPMTRSPAGGYEFSPNDPRRKTGCLIGTALEILGVPRGLLAQHPDVGIWGIAEELKNREILLLTEGQIDVLADIQGLQDTGSTWGDALSEGRQTWERLSS